MAVAWTVLLSSCIDFELKSKLKNNGSGEMTMTVTSPAKPPFDQAAELPTQEELDQEAKDRAEENKAKAEKAGVEMSDFSIKLVGDKKVETSTVKFDSLEKLNAFFNEGEEGKTETKVTLEDKDGKKAFKMVMKVAKEEEQPDEQQMAMMKAMLKDAKMTLNWNFEGEVTEASEGGKIGEDKKSVTWVVPLVDLFEKGLDLSATYK